MCNFKKSKFSFYHQLESTDCAAACLAMIASLHGKKYQLSQIKSLFEFTRIGVSIQDILDVSPKAGLQSVALKLTPKQLQEIPLPAILYWKQDHFIILREVNQKRGETFYHLADPAYGKIVLDEENFINEWKGVNEKGVAIVSEAADNFNEISLPETAKNSLFNSLFFKEAMVFIKENKLKYSFSFSLIIIALSANWLIPFTFQRIIDFGITPKALKIVYFLLLAQLVLFISNFISDFFSNLILTKINFKLSIDLKKNLLKKLMRLPVNYFDTRLNTETLQRLGDQNTIQSFITWKGIDFVLNILNILVFGSILFYFNWMIFCIYAFLSIMSIVWVLFFLKKRAILEYAMFLRQSENNNNIYEFIMNMPEIKINDAQNHIIGKILNTIEKLNKLELRSLFLNMYQVVGVNFLSKLKEIIAIAVCAIFIIHGNMTLGTLLSISYVIGQLIGPLQNLVGFIRETQDADIANKRIGEIYNNKDEDNEKKQHIENETFKKINIENISFKYPGNFNPFVLNNISFEIPKNSITAIVGASGSGKTTLLKLLLSYYTTTSGNILLDDFNLNNVLSNEWRKKCGIVLQDGHIFSGTIAENIVFSEEKINEKRLLFASKIACIDEFINSLPMGYNTKIGNVGIQLSGGQTQRILIARAVYKNPQYIFFDEATSALDAENEKIIHDNLQEFFKGKTVLIIAHRLSTVKNADQIIVLKNGKVVEKGSHSQLVAAKGEYFNLVKNQLELGG
ncbi:MAG: peptidase domain-containing ABC transporter [Flavobacteriaceae bacterium]|jgi:ATP-binding cassette subfamily B protein|nr:peptidase domain-containing ABC transporter [Flavobacteriaceae bacterium]